MINIRKSEERGRADRGWLNAYFTFSFADYHDPRYMGFRVLRVLNDDRIAPGKGFGPHAHRDMEIITYVLEGALRHRDSTGQSHILGPNEVQTMSAGNGIVHSEFNASNTDGVHSIQVWILPSSEDGTPGYQQISFDPDEKRGRLRLLAGPSGRDAGATSINQDARLYVAELSPRDTLQYPIPSGRHAWAQIVKGEITINGIDLKAGDGVAVSDERELLFAGSSNGGELLLFDLP